MRRSYPSESVQHKRGRSTLTVLNCHPCIAARHPVREGEKGSLVVYANAITRTEHDEATSQDVEREIPFLKGSIVFNVEQIEGLPAVYSRVEPKLTPVERIVRAGEFFAATKAVVNYGGTRA
jgi:antirestriction protein ArdC